MTKLDLWQRLIEGRSLEGLDVPSSDGRIDLTGLRLPEPAVVSRRRNSVAEVVEIEPNGNVRGARWRNIDFSGSRLNSLRFHDCEIDNCRFENCQLSDLRMWSTKITRSSFQRSDLQEAALGGVSNDGHRNLFLEVDFSHADLSRTVYKAAAFDGCLFRDTRLHKVDFQTSTFCRCRFEGELSYVLFYRRGFKGDAFPPNEMNDVDMRGAKLRYVEFRGLALDHVRLPQDHDHLVVGNYLAAVDKLLAVFERQGDLPSRKLGAYFSIMKKWTPPERTQGVISLLDVADMAGIEGVRQVLEIVGQ